MAIPKDVADKLYGILGDQPIMMLTTVSPKGYMRTRPMQLQARNERIADFWFATYPETHKVSDIEENGQVCLSYYDPGRKSYLSIAGRAVLSENRGELHQVWHESMRPWFPNGPDDPKLMLLRITASHVEFCDPAKGRLGLLWEETKATLGGETPEMPPVHRLDVA